MPNDLNVSATYWSQEPFGQSGVPAPPADGAAPPSTSLACWRPPGA